MLISNNDYIKNYPNFLGGIDINKKINYITLVERIANVNSQSKLNIINNYFRKIAVTYNLKSQGAIIQLINDKEKELQQLIAAEDNEQRFGINDAITMPSELLQPELSGENQENENGL